MHPTLGSDTDGSESVHEIAEDLLGERIETLASWIQDLDAQVRATAAAGDEKTLKELRRALDAWSKRDPKFEDRLTDRVDVLADRLATLSSAVNTTAAAHAGSDGEIASLRRELEQDRAKLQGALSELRPSGAAGEIEELRRAIAQLSTERPSGKRDKGASDLQETIVNLGERVDTLAKTVATTAAGLAGREGELASLRRELEEGISRLEQSVAGVQRQPDRSGLAELEQRFHSLTQSVASLGAGLSAREGDVVALRAELGQADSRARALAGELSQSLDAVASQVTAFGELPRDTDLIDALERRLDATSTSVDSLTEQLSSIAASVNGTTAALASRDIEVADLRRSAESTNTSVEQLLAHVRQLAAGSSVSELESRLVELASQVTALAELPRDTDLVEALERRLEATNASLTSLAEQLSSLETGVDGATAALAGRDTEVAELRRAAEHANASIEQLVAHVRQLPGRATVSELETRLDELASRMAALGELPRDTELIDALERRLDATDTSLASLTGQLSSSTESTAAGLASRDAELAELRRSAEIANAGIERLVAQVEELPGPPALAELDTKLVSLARAAAESTAQAASAGSEIVSLRTQLEQRHESSQASLEAVERKIAALSSQLAALETSEAADALAARIANVEAAEVGVQATLRDLRQSLDELPESGALDAAFESRLDQLSAQTEAVARQLTAVEASTTEVRAHDVTRTTEVERQLVATTERLADVERAAGERTSEIERVSTALADEQSWVRARLDALLAAVEKVSTQDVAPELEAMNARLARMESEREQADARAEDARAASEAERQATKRELAALLARTVESESNGASEELVASLEERLGALERDGVAVASEISRSGTFWASEADALEKRLHEVTSHVRTLVAGGQQALSREAHDQDVGELRGLVDGLRTRLAEAEKELAAQGESHDVGSRLDELTTRLNSVEKARPAVPTAQAAAGDGRFRIELRALELRMQHAEMAARENREAVLVQLERLASRMEWRLQGLEAPEEDSEPVEPEEQSLGQVVPIRGGVET